MQNYCKTIGALAAASALAAGNATAFDIDYELSTGYASAYLWRGFNLGNDLVETELNAATEINGFGLSAGAWYATSRFNAPGFTNTYEELNLFGEISYDLGFATMGVGYIYYYFPELGGHAAEIPVTIARDFGIVDASVTVFVPAVSGARYDNDVYTELLVTNETELNSCLTLNSGVAVGYQGEKGKFAHITAKVGLEYAFTENATFTPYVAHSWSLSENGIYAGTKNQLIGGAMVSVSF